MLIEGEIAVDKPLTAQGYFGSESPLICKARKGPGMGAGTPVPARETSGFIKEHQHGTFRDKPGP